MNSTLIAIQDAGVFFLLLQVKALPALFQLPYTFCTTDLAWAGLDEEQKQALAPYVASGQLEVVPCTGEDAGTISALAAQSSRLTFTEWSVYYVATVRNCALLVGCKCLKRWTYIPPVEIYSLAWLLRQLLAQACITKSRALAIVAKLVKLNPKLEEECLVVKEACMLP